MLHDRTDDDRIAITHDLAVMLGVRRPGVTNALHVLEGDGFIKSARGEIFIRDRHGLVQFADDAYGFPEEEYSRLMGVSPRGAKVRYRPSTQPRRFREPDRTGKLVAEIAS